MAKTPGVSPAVQSQFMSRVNYEVSHYRDPYGREISPHSHDFYELYYFISGSIDYTIDGYKFGLEPGDILLISPENLHCPDFHDPSVAYERIVLWLNPKYVKSLSTEKTDLGECFAESYGSKHYLIRNMGLSEKIKDMLLALCEIKDGYGEDIKSEIGIKSVLLALCEYFRTSTEKENGQGLYSKKNGAIVYELIRYIDENISSELSLDMLAERMFVSKYYLSRLFKEEMNITIHAYIIKKRLVLSKKYIEEGLSADEVCFCCGFSDYSNFFRAFRREFGITPGKYRQITQQGGT